MVRRCSSCRTRARASNVHRSALIAVILTSVELGAVTDIPRTHCERADYPGIVCCGVQRLIAAPIERVEWVPSVCVEVDRNDK